MVFDETTIVTVRVGKATRDLGCKEERLTRRGKWWVIRKLG